MKYQKIKPSKKSQYQLTGHTVITYIQIIDRVCKTSSKYSKKVNKRLTHDICHQRRKTSTNSLKVPYQSTDQQMFFLKRLTHDMSNAFSLNSKKVHISLLEQRQYKYD